MANVLGTKRNSSAFPAKIRQFVHTKVVLMLFGAKHRASYLLFKKKTVLNDPN